MSSDNANNTASSSEQNTISGFGFLNREESGVYWNLYRQRREISFNSDPVAWYEVNEEMRSLCKTAMWRKKEELGKTWTKLSEDAEKNPVFLDAAKEAEKKYWQHWNLFCEYGWQEWA